MASKANLVVLNQKSPQRVSRPRLRGFLISILDLSPLAPSHDAGIYEMSCNIETSVNRGDPPTTVFSALSEISDAVSTRRFCLIKRAIRFTNQVFAIDFRARFRDGHAQRNRQLHLIVTTIKNR